MLKFSKKLKEKADISFYERGIKSKIINQILNAIIEIKLYKKSKFFIHKFKNSIDREFQSIKFFEIINKIPKLVIEITIILIICISIILSDYNGVDIQSIIPIIVLYFVAALRVYPSINNILLHRLALINGSISISKVCEEFNIPCMQIRSISNKIEKRNRENWDLDLAIINLNVEVEKIINNL